MAIKASASITVSCVVDVAAVYRYYLLQSSTLSTPAKPTANPPGGSWVLAEPSYTSGSTNSLYFTDLTVFSDGTFAYSNVSLSSSYEAAKAAWNKAQTAQGTADAAQASVDNLSIGGRNLALGSQKMSVAAARTNRYIYHRSGEELLIRSDGFVEVACTNNWHGLVIYPDQYNFNVGEDLTLSAMMRSDIGFDISFYLMCYDSSNTRVFPNDVVIDGAVRSGASRNLSVDFGTTAGAIETPRKVYTTFTWSQGLQDLLDTGGNVQITLQVHSITAGGTVYFYAPKLEKGNRATDWTPAPEDVDSAIQQVASSTEVIVGTQTTATGAWTGNASFASLVSGQVILYWLPFAGSGNATLNLTLPNGTTTGAKNVYINATSRCTTHIAAGNMVQMVYRENVTIGTGTYTGWWISRALNDNNYDRLLLNNNVVAKTAITNARLIVGDAGGYFHLTAGVAFNVNMPILYSAGTIAAGSARSHYLSYPSINLRTALTGNSSSWAATQYATVYLAGTLSGDTFTVASSDCLTAAPADETLTYISLGYMYSVYQMYLYPEHPMLRIIGGVLTATSQIAWEASVTAEQAATTAEEAATTAQEALETAQETYSLVRLESDGLHIKGYQLDDENNRVLTGGEVLIDSSGMNVNLNGATYSQFKADYVQFGNYQLRRTADGGLAFKLRR